MSITEGVVVTVSHLLVGNYSNSAGTKRIGLNRKLDAKDLRFVQYEHTA